MIFALVIVLLIPLLLVIFLIRDRNSKLLLSFFSWGCVAGLISYYLERWIISMVNINFENFAIQFAPPIEEFFKALPLLFFITISSSLLKEKDIMMAFSFSIMFHAFFNLYVQFSLFGKVIAVITVIFLYTFSWLFFELYHDIMKKFRIA